MTPWDRSTGGLALPLFLIGSAITALAALFVGIKRAPPRHPTEAKPIAVERPMAPSESIRSEALVFRTRAGMMAIAFTTRREREAHPRTLETMRYLRTYPGAPPRIPHELTPDEFRTGACNPCHEQGGYSRRFSAYVPVTPHAANGPCLQCHVGDDPVMAVSLVSPDPNRRCHQCHGGGGSARAEANALLVWRTTAWPKLARKTPDSTPPPIPHDLQNRGNCLACHAGPGAVAEIRTTHPERADCRQCHVVPDPAARVFTRGASGRAGAGGGR